MWTQFFLENIHFSIYIFTALVFFAVFWLYWDAWLTKKNLKELPKILGFLFLSLSYLANSAKIESTILPTSPISREFLPTITVVAQFLGYVLLIIGLTKEPLQRHPSLKEKLAQAIIPFTLFSFSFLTPLRLLVPILIFVTAFLYLRRSTKGLERHLRPISLSFYIICASELVSLTSFFRDTTNVNLYNLVSPFGLLWISQHAILFIGIFILGKWVWGYLLKRLHTQLFMVFTLASLFIFLFTTVSFTALLLKNIQDETLSRLDTDVKVLKLAIESKEEEIASDVEVLAQDRRVQEGLSDEESLGDLIEISESFLVGKKLTSLVIVDSLGQIVARGEDRENVGESLSEDILVKRALSGESTSSVVVKDGVVAPEILIQSAVSVKKDSEIVGVVLAGEVLDNAFVDSVKKATELEAGIYGHNVLSASTIVAPDGKSRWVGAVQTDERVNKKVLEEGVSYTGSVSIYNTDYYGAYLALKDADEVPVGMLFVGKPQVVVLQTAARSIEFTFLFTATLIVFSIIPSYLVSRYLTYQIG